MTRRRGWRLLWLVAMLAAGLAADGRAQGLQNGVITGAVRSSDGLSLPGVTVTVSSPSLQGTRSATTDINGNYVVRGLPPGDYSVAFELQGMSPKTEKTVVALGRTTSVDAEMSIAAVDGIGRRRCRSPRPWSRIRSSARTTRPPRSTRCPTGARRSSSPSSRLG